MKKVFIVHGHESTAMYELKEFVSSLGLAPVVLAKEDDLGLTIVEKFEHYAKDCQFALVLLTPDDKQAEDLAGHEKWRARQNVILEMGWFMHRLGRKGMALLHKGSVELPSDLLGVLYLPFRGSIFEVSERIRQRLAGQGVL